MSEQSSAHAEQSNNIPERPKEAQEGEKGPSKNALKKAAKEKEKVGGCSTHVASVGISAECYRIG